MMKIEDSACHDVAASSDGYGAWQPIATAPLDGTPCLLWFPDQMEIELGYWLKTSIPDFVGWWQWRAEDLHSPWGAGDPKPKDFPTHWMRLPAPPQSTT